ncbi:hypothetical protein EVA_02439 [gut metagenome]|uniref:Uncharacterized protein n=1 Tax=gut metagenome TaxID=749906 RepID=J9GP29_9ZZZZ
MVSVSTFTFTCFKRSLTATPNFCSSSMISNPKSFHLTVFPINLCVPTRISIFPSANSCNTRLVCDVERARLK